MSKLRALATAVLLLAPCGCSGGGPSAPAAAASGASAPLDQRWVDDKGATVKLSTFRGSPLVVTMFYRACQLRCPMTIEKLRRVESAFARAGRPVSFALVTLDPKSDTVERLAAFKRARSLDDASWHMLRGDEQATRELNRFLEVRAFKDDNHIDHDVKIAVLDAQGQLVGRYAGWDFSEEDAVLATAR